MFSRDLGSQAALTGFGAQLPTGAYPQFVLTNSAGDYAGFTRSFIQFIQTLAGEQPAYPDLDAVMLVRLPLEYRDATQKLQPVPGPLGMSSGWALIRNQAFAQQPDVNLNQYADWAIVRGGVPQNTAGFWVSGGHANPTFFAYSRFDPDGTGQISEPSLLVREVSWKFRAPQYRWTPIFAGDLIDGAKYGPAHVNPFNPLQIYILTGTGVMSTVDGGTTWQPESELTALLTENGRYPFTSYTDAWDAWGTCAGSHANAMATLSHMAFNRYAPEQVVVASPFTGVFYNDGSGQWQDLSAGLPQPLSPVSSVGIDNQGIYVALEGRSVVRITFEYPYISRLLEIILEELFQNIIHGIRDDGPGIVGPPSPSPPDPIGPILRQLDPRARDEILGWVLRQLAHLITDEAARGDVHRLGARLMAHKSIETLGLTLQSSQRPPD